MVKNLTPHDHVILNEALKRAAIVTAAKIKLIVVPASDSYRDYALAYGLILGSIAALTLWALDIVMNFPILLGTQLGLIALFDALHSLITPLVPHKVRHHRAAQNAMRHYHVLHGHAAPDQAFVLLFVSLAERYVHVITNPIVHQRVPENWQSITQSFAAEMRHGDVNAACAHAIDQIAVILAPPFPNEMAKTA